MNRKYPSIQDVARLAGVSTATVSRTLSRPELVTEATRSAVHIAIEAAGYKLSPALHSLQRRTTGGVVALVPNLSNPFFCKVLDGITSVLSPSGYALLVADTTTQGCSTANGLAGYIEQGRADGLILLDGSLDPALFSTGSTARMALPLVQVGEWIEGLSAPRVSSDNREGTGIAVRHLARLGHRRIGHVTGPAGNVLTDARKRGLKDALAALDLPCRKEWMFDGDFSFAAGVRAARAWTDLSDRPTGMVFANDEMACSFVSELRRAGFSVPGDVSVIGFDDIDLGTHLSPALTTLRQPRAELGAHAARTLLELMAKGSGAGCAALDLVLPVELILRESTSAPPFA
ncbi:LacI family DNA-binding transcriptional regulator (plasmid) [Paroceanicella profunda]|uniref:LacI family DNA-binding transcriptional regulator n=1 Tax=Paroceanicella profunda TaxID=2579971 RepID=A0A5B8FJG0_9RHOB|nr:LacI family DNA-binding transcriptional regulator [Paroceanicella profunda]QDL94387.1 LacI family DNA-binding transcriptional regulator [Paroceanicella profunda]